MKLAIIVAFVCSALTASASPALALKAPKGHEYIAPGPKDKRSPCPGLNALANHGFLPRSGYGIGVKEYVDACKEGLNVGPSFCIPIGIVGLQSKCTTAKQMNLEQLKHHDVLIEHDGSLAHQDTAFGKNYVINKRSYDMWFSTFKGHKTTTLALASEAKFRRVNDSLTNNPHVNYGARELALSYGETALIVQTMGRSLTSGVARVDWVKSLVLEERLPYELGWTPGPTVSLASIGAMAPILQSKGPTPGDEGIEVLTAGSYATLFTESKLIFNSTSHPSAC